MTDGKARNADLSALRIDREPQEDRGAGTSRRRLIVVAGTLLILLLAAAAYVFARNFSRAVPVKVAAIRVLDTSQGEVTLSANGYVVAQVQAAIASKGTGRIEYLGVVEGDKVKAGQVVARLEDDDVAAVLSRARADLQMSEAALEEAQASLNEARLDFERNRQLHNQGIASKSEYDLFEAKYKRALAAAASSEARIRVGKAAVKEAEVQVENTRIRAPFDGIVLAKNADVGEIVAPLSGSASSRSAVVTIADMGSLEVEADVSESNIHRVTPEQACEIVLDAFPNVRYKGYVHKIVPTADRAKATVLTKVRFEKFDEKVLPEMSAKVNFLAPVRHEGEAEAEAMIVAPKAAVTEREKGSVVFVVRGDTVAETPVVTGGSIGDSVEIKGGVSAGEAVVLNPSSDLKSGAKIVIGGS
ncbi:efflux RND transporter periplasmic adaptor subunit [Candidatus Poribacteria bacterium]|nr:efflux RND transporter periplasmic adaptor subunit [Candidatus Poribacteria bacterium]